MSRSKFLIRLPAIGRGEETRIIIDGEDITNKVSSVSVTASVSNPTTVWLEFPHVDVEIEGEGEVNP
jgi:hypothetical protein